jgi:hypothetical protein
MGRNVPFWCFVRLQGRLFRPFSDSLSSTNFAVQASGEVGEDAPRSLAGRWPVGRRSRHGCFCQPGYRYVWRRSWLGLLGPAGFPFSLLPAVGPIFRRNPTAGRGGIDPCAPRMRERLGTPADGGYARIALRGSTAPKTAAGTKYGKERRAMLDTVNVCGLPYVIPDSMSPTGRRER